MTCVDESAEQTCCGTGVPEGRMGTGERYAGSGAARCEGPGSRRQVSACEIAGAQARALHVGQREARALELGSEVAEVEGEHVTDDDIAPELVDELGEQLGERRGTGEHRARDPVDEAGSNLVGSRDRDQ